MPSIPPRELKQFYFLCYCPWMDGQMDLNLLPLFFRPSWSPECHYKDILMSTFSFKLKVCSRSSSYMHEGLAGFTWFCLKEERISEYSKYEGRHRLAPVLFHWSFNCTIRGRCYEIQGVWCLRIGALLQCVHQSIKTALEGWGGWSSAAQSFPALSATAPLPCAVLLGQRASRSNSTRFQLHI